MLILYNNQLLPAQDLQLPLPDRAFQYNDGFFETAIIQNGRIRFWKQHQQRIREAAEALHLELPESFPEDGLEERLLQLAQREQAASYGRLKLKVWRAGAGLYTPHTNKVNWLATAAPAAPAPRHPIRIGICQQVWTAYTPLSHFKGPNAPLYVMAGLEKQAQEQEDMLLLSQQGMVAELISSNIFWLKQSILYTPALQTGCVNGILRRNILDWCQQQEVQVREAQQEPAQLWQAEAVFAANVTGIRGVAGINGQELRQQEGFLEKLRQELQL